MSAIEIRDVTKQFGTVVAVNDLTLDVPDGSIYGFIGPNGSGKTTTIRMIMNILVPDSGRHPGPRAIRASRRCATRSGTCPKSAASTSA